MEEFPPAEGEDEEVDGEEEGGNAEDFLLKWTGNDTDLRCVRCVRKWTYVW